MVSAGDLEDILASGRQGGRGGRRGEGGGGLVKVGRGGRVGRDMQGGTDFQKEGRWLHRNRVEFPLAKKAAPRANHII